MTRGTPALPAPTHGRASGADGYRPRDSRPCRKMLKTQELRDRSTWNNERTTMDKTLRVLRRLSTSGFSP